VAILIAKSANHICKGNACYDKNKINSFIFVPKMVYCNNITIEIKVNASSKN
jgi:hypothetical protein